jgi:hypothetical protein
LSFPLIQKRRKEFPEVRKMLAASLVFGSLMTVLFLIVGLIGGWTARESG